MSSFLFVKKWSNLQVQVKNSSTLFFNSYPLEICQASPDRNASITHPNYSTLKIPSITVNKKPVHLLLKCTQILSYQWQQLVYTCPPSKMAALCGTQKDKFISICAWWHVLQWLELSWQSLELTSLRRLQLIFPTVNELFYRRLRSWRGRISSPCKDFVCSPYLVAEHVL